ncbi:hypothetical protein [Streptomyces sp. NPDC088360]|uniref:hypothetical protein n=1 Tax=Streptomyces sp. NPDC088360 TaxID=3154515 RepID=UPI00344C5FF4
MSKMAAVSAGAAAFTMVASPPAHANWSGTIFDFVSGQESRRWKDDGYNRVTFTGCDPNGLKSVGVKMRRHKSMAPDPSYGEKTFKKCATDRYPNNVSRGAWHGLPRGKYYFEIGKLRGANKVSVYEVHVWTRNSHG